MGIVRTAEKPLFFSYIYFNEEVFNITLDFYNSWGCIFSNIGSNTTTILVSTELIRLSQALQKSEFRFRYHKNVDISTNHAW